MMRAKKTTEVEVPELSDLSVDPAQAAAVQQLDTLCQAVRAVQSQIKPLEDVKAKLMDDGEGGGIKPLAAALNLPERVLGVGWDLRKTVRKSESLDVAKLKLELLRLDIRFEVLCPPTITTLIGTVEVCNLCAGAGRRTLEGIAAVNYLIDECTETKVSESWSVYARKEEADGRS